MFSLPFRLPCSWQGLSMHSFTSPFSHVNRINICRWIFVMHSLFVRWEQNYEYFRCLLTFHVFFLFPFATLQIRPTLSLERAFARPVHKAILLIKRDAELFLINSCFPSHPSRVLQVHREVTVLTMSQWYTDILRFPYFWLIFLCISARLVPSGYAVASGGTSCSPCSAGDMPRHTHPHT